MGVGTYPLADPLLDWVARGDLLFQLLIVEQIASLCVDDEQTTRLQTSLGLHTDSVGQVDHSNLGGHVDHAVGCGVVAGRSQSVSVQNGTDVAAVGEDHESWEGGEGERGLFGSIDRGAEKKGGPTLLTTRLVLGGEFYWPGHTTLGLLWDVRCQEDWVIWAEENVGYILSQLRTLSAYYTLNLL